MVFVSSSSIGVHLNTVLSLLMFKYDVKSGFPAGSSSFASFGPIFMKKLFNFSAISFLSVICFSLILKCAGNLFWILDLLITSAIVSHVFLIVSFFRFIGFQVVIFSLGFPL